jgi:uncharacterized protein HemY
MVSPVNAHADAQVAQILCCLLLLILYLLLLLLLLLCRLPSHRRSHL